jgi:hypothetical protein
MSSLLFLWPGEGPSHTDQEKTNTPYAPMSISSLKVIEEQTRENRYVHTTIPCNTATVAHPFVATSK